MKIIKKVPIWVLLGLVTFSNTTEMIFNTALPSIRENFNIDAARIQMAASIYFIGFAFGIFSLGRVSDIFGRRPVVLAGISLYIIATIISIFIIDFEILLFLRFLQAFGASIGSVIGQAIARDSYSGKELSYIYASLSIGIAIIPSLGAVVSGYIIEYYSWRYILCFLSVITSILLLTYAYYLPETNPYIGMGFRNKYFTIIKVALQDRVLLLYAFIVGTFNGILNGFMIEAPFLFMNFIGITSSRYGQLLFLLSMALVCGSFFGRLLVKKHVKSKKIVLTGLVLSLSGVIILVAMALMVEYMEILSVYILVPMILLPMMLHFIGHNMLIPIMLRYALEDYAKVTGTAGSIFGTLYYFLVALISFTISRLHDEHGFIKFALLLFVLVVLSSIAWYCINKLLPQKRKYEFN